MEGELLNGNFRSCDFSNAHVRNGFSCSISDYSFYNNDSRYNLLHYRTAFYQEVNMKYICPICGTIADPKTDRVYKIRTRYERHLTLVYIDCYNKLLKRGNAVER